MDSTPTLAELEARARSYGAKGIAGNGHGGDRPPGVPKPGPLQKSLWQDEAFWHCIQRLYAEHPTLDMPAPITYLQKRYALMHRRMTTAPKDFPKEKTEMYLKVRRSMLRKMYAAQKKKVTPPEYPTARPPRPAAAAAPAWTPAKHAHPRGRRPTY